MFFVHLYNISIEGGFVSFESTAILEQTLTAGLQCR